MLKGRGLQVRVRPGQEAAFAQKLQTIYKEQRHQMQGTLLRSILADEQNPSLVHIWLAWKDNELSDEEMLDQELAAFKAEFADVLDWQTGRSSGLKGLLYTT